MIKMVVRTEEKFSSIAQIGMNHDKKDIYWLELSFCKIDSLDGIRGYSNLIVLSMLNCGIKSIEGISRCTSLKRIYLGNNSIENIDEISRCENLQTLSLVNNKIRDVDVLEKCKNLEMLLLSGNFLKSIPRMPENLILLSAARNQLESIQFLENCENLVEVSIANNRISSLKPLSKCRKLRTVIANHNRICSLEGIESPKLSKLYLGSNLVSSLTPLRYAKKRLKRLDVSNNRLTSVRGLMLKPENFSSKGNLFPDSMDLDIEFSLNESEDIREHPLIIDKILNAQARRIQKIWGNYFWDEIFPDEDGNMVNRACLRFCRSI